MSTILKPTRRNFVKTAAAVSSAGAMGFPLIAKGAAKHTVKIASLAPQNSSWHNAFKKVAREIESRTDGEIDIKIYAGGTMGDEPAMVRKMRTGQLDGAAVTSVGLKEINEQVLMLQLPLLFRNESELDKVRNAMSDTFKKLLAEGGFILSAWGDVGRVYLFSNSKIEKPSDAQATKMWVWDADPISREVMKVTGVNAVPLGVPDVLPSLQTGVIDAFGSAPYAAVALQWYTKAAYVTNLTLSMGIGGSVMSETSYAKLSDYHDIMREVTDETYGKLLKRIRKDNKKAMGTLVDKGITVVEPTNIGDWLDLSVKVRENLTGSLFKEELVNEMLDHLNS